MSDATGRSQAAGVHEPAGADLAGFAQRLRERFALGDRGCREGVRVTLARAPGRLDLMGGIADYSGSLVLQWPIREAALVAVQPRDDGVLEIASLASEGHPAERRLLLDAGEWAAMRSLGGYAAVRDAFRARPDDFWATYVAGVLLVLERERGADVSRGFGVWIDSRVPEGKGVSSSAALEVATMRAAAAAIHLDLDGVELATMCQMAENHVVGAPCGIMDQMTSALGEEHQLLALLCQPAEVQGHARLPDELGVWGIDSGIRHAVTGSDYTSVRIGAAMGYRILTDDENPGLAERLRKVDEKCRSGARNGPDEAEAIPYHDTRWRGYLANIDPATLDAELAARLPERLSGREFLERYHSLVDSVVTVSPDEVYAVRQPTAHPIHEHARVRRFAEILRGSAQSEADREELGRLMYGSHASYSACGLGSGGTDRLVELVREAGPAQGLYGAKITGGGSGGTVAVLGRSEAGEAVAAVARRYAGETGRRPYVFDGSSPGAMRVEPIGIDV